MKKWKVEYKQKERKNDWSPGGYEWGFCWNKVVKCSHCCKIERCLMCNNRFSQFAQSFRIHPSNVWNFSQVQLDSLKIWFPDCTDWVTWKIESIETDISENLILRVCQFDGSNIRFWGCRGCIHVRWQEKIAFISENSIWAARLKDVCLTINSRPIDSLCSTVVLDSRRGVARFEAVDTICQVDWPWVFWKKHGRNVAISKWSTVLTEIQQPEAEYRFLGSCRKDFAA